MTSPQKESISRWLPAIVALVGVGSHIAYVSKWAGSFEARVVALEASAQTIVPRSEYLAKMVSRDTEIGDIKAIVRDTNLKVEKLNQQLVDLSIYLRRSPTGRGDQ